MPAEDKSTRLYFSTYISNYEVFVLSLLITFLFIVTKCKSNLVSEGSVLVLSWRYSPPQ